MPSHPIAIPWLEDLPNYPPTFPAANTALIHPRDLTGLVCASQSVDAAMLKAAYINGIFPWYVHGQPVLWWSTDPRMVLPVAEFKLSDSLRKKIRRLCVREQQWQIRFDQDFESVMRACAKQSRAGQNGTWIQDEMIDAYVALHRLGFAHCVSLHDAQGQMLAGLYCVVIGQAVYGESMFTTVSDGSKTCLAALIAWCQNHAVELIDCQQETSHLASLGARPIARAAFIEHLNSAALRPNQPFLFDPNALVKLVGGL